MRTEIGNMFGLQCCPLTYAVVRSPSPLTTDIWRTGFGQSKRFGEPPAVADGDGIRQHPATTRREVNYDRHLQTGSSVHDIATALGLTLEHVRQAAGPHDGRPRAHLRSVPDPPDRSRARGPTGLPANWWTAQPCGAVPARPGCITGAGLVGAENLCHQAIYMNYASGAVVMPDAEVV
jgi:hypothetical protein